MLDCFVAKAKAYGYETIQVFVHLSTAELNKARISQRIAEGGHSVPEDKIESRIPRIMQNIKTAIPIADQVYLLDNSDYEKPFQLVASIKDGSLHSTLSTLPDWVKFMVPTLIL